MPIYEYRCEECTHPYEQLVGISAPAPPCPRCDSAEVVRLISGFTSPKKGSGVDFRSIPYSAPSGGCCGGACRH
jgi:putative FmdB family regulatory protein